MAHTVPEVHDHLHAARADVLALTVYPREVWRQLRSNNPNGRLNLDIRQCTVIRISHRAAIIRLVGAVLAEQQDEWTECRRCLALDAISRSRLTLLTSQPAGTQTHRRAALTTRPTKDQPRTPGHRS